MCLGLFVIELYQKIHQNMETVSASQLSSQKSEWCLNSQKSLQLNIFFFLFFQGVSLFWCPQQCMVNLFLCVVAACINKTSLESLSPTFQSASNGNRQWECLAAAAHISQLLPPSSPCSRNYYGTALTPWSPPGKIWMISHSVCKGCVFHEVTLQWPLPCCWAPPNLQHSSLLCRKERAHLFFSFLIIFCV